MDERMSIKISKELKNNLETLKHKYQLKSINEVIEKLILNSEDSNYSLENNEKLILDSLNIFFNTLDKQSLNKLNDSESKILKKAKSNLK